MEAPPIVIKNCRSLFKRGKYLKLTGFLRSDEESGRFRRACCVAYKNKGGAAACGSICRVYAANMWQAAMGPHLPSFIPRFFVSMLCFYVSLQYRLRDSWCRPCLVVTHCLVLFHLILLCLFALVVVSYFVSLFSSFHATLHTHCNIT